MSPAMIVFAGSSVVGATLRANFSVPPFFGLEAWALRTPERLAEVDVAAPLASGNRGPSAMSVEAPSPYRKTSRREIGPRWDCCSVTSCALHVLDRIGGSLKS